MLTWGDVQRDLARTSFRQSNIESRGMMGATLREHYFELSRVVNGESNNALFQRPKQSVVLQSSCILQKASVIDETRQDHGHASLELLNASQRAGLKADVIIPNSKR